jgi:hypothetical protein
MRIMRSAVPRYPGTRRWFFFFGFFDRNKPIHDKREKKKRMAFYFWGLSHCKYDWKFKKWRWAEEYQCRRPSHFYTQPSRSLFCSVQALADRETMSWRWRTDQPYGVLRTEHMVPDLKHQPPHLWGLQHGVLHTKYNRVHSTPYSVLCIAYSSQPCIFNSLEPKKWFAQGVLTSQGGINANLFAHACIKQGPGCVHTLYRKDSRKSKQKQSGLCKEEEKEIELKTWRLHRRF